MFRASEASEEGVSRAVQGVLRPTELCCPLRCTMVHQGPQLVTEDTRVVCSIPWYTHYAPGPHNPISCSYADSACINAHRGTREALHSRHATARTYTT